MRSALWILCLWPGLPRLWLRGDWLGLLAAAAFALVVNATLLSTFVWLEWLPAAWSWAAWSITVGSWTVSAVWAYRRLPALLEPPNDESVGDLFAQAQSEYLQGDWYRAETLLGRLIRQNADDVDARLMLATLYRHTRRIGEARNQLRRIQRFEWSAKWNEEIRREWKRLERLEADETNGQDETKTDGTKTDGADAGHPEAGHPEAGHPEAGHPEADDTEADDTEADDVETPHGHDRPLEGDTRRADSIDKAA